MVDNLYYVQNAIYANIYEHGSDSSYERGNSNGVSNSGGSP